MFAVRFPPNRSVVVGSAHSSARRHSTIDTVIRAGQELPAIRHEQRDDLSDVLGGADATQRNIPEPIRSPSHRTAVQRCAAQ